MPNTSHLLWHKEFALRLLSKTSSRTSYQDIEENFETSKNTLSIQEFPMSILDKKRPSPQDNLTQEERIRIYLHARRGSRRSQQDLHNIFSQAPPQDLDPAGATQHECKASLDAHLAIFQEQFYARIGRKNAAPLNVAARFVHAVGMHMDISQDKFYARIYRKKAVPQERGNPAARTV